MNAKKIIRFLYNKIKLSFVEKKYQGRLKYIFEDNNSDKLIIVFSGFAVKVPKYNYMRTLKDFNVDKLFILDDFGHRGSYYWFEKGYDKPLQLVSGLIDTILGGAKPYKKLYMAGSSKGGTCAIYYGLKYEADEIFAGACQYHVGTYLSPEKLRDVFFAMMGQQADEITINKLNRMLPEMIANHKNSKTIVHVLYSKQEHTYDEHIIDLLSDLKYNGITTIEKEDYYKTHDENGIYFSSYLKEYFRNESSFYSEQ